MKWKHTLPILGLAGILIAPAFAITIDTHDDTTQRLIWQNFDLGQRDTKGSIDIPRMRDGNMDGIFFSIWMPGQITGQKAVDDAVKQIEAVNKQVVLHADNLSMATTADEVEAARAKGKIAVLFGMEGGHMINNDLNNLRLFARLGVRYMTLTHSVNTDWADSSTDKAVHNGLNNFGKDVVREMNKLGMMVDISHVSDKTFYDALAVSRAPMIASHSSVRSICQSPRNMTDDMIKALAAKGGVIQINFNTSFIDEAFRTAAEASPEAKVLLDELMQRCGMDMACMILGGQDISRQLVKEGKLPRVDWTKIVEHIDYAVKLVGADHVGIGSDFDGADMPFGMEDAAHLPQIANALRERGYKEDDVQKIMGGNVLRVMREVERVAKQLLANR